MGNVVNSSKPLTYRRFLRECLLLQSLQLKLWSCLTSCQGISDPISMDAIWLALLTNDYKRVGDRNVCRSLEILNEKANIRRLHFLRANQVKPRRFATWRVFGLTLHLALGLWARTKLGCNDDSANEISERFDKAMIFQQFRHEITVKCHSGWVAALACINNRICVRRNGEMGDASSMIYTADALPGLLSFHWADNWFSTNTFRPR